MIERLLDAIAELGGTVLHLVAFSMAFGETALFLGLLLPGETAIVVAGAAAERAGEPLTTMIIAVAVGAILGDSVSYAIGRHWGPAAIRRWEPIRRRLEPRLERAADFFERYGPAAVFLGRWPAALRSLVPAAAGISEMPYRKFVVWNVVTSIVWAVATVGAGYLLGRHVSTIADRISWAIAAAIVLGLVIWRIKRWLARRAGSPSGAHESGVYD